MFLRIAALGALLVAGMAVADDDTSRAKLMGTWQVTDAGKEPFVWTFQDKGETLHVILASGARTLAEFDCDAFGHDCNIKDGGRPAKVSLYFHGPKLVELETRGNVVWRRTFEITGDGDAMELEQTQITPSAKSEMQHYKRVTAH